MLDFGFSEILLTSAIALVVLGPERLPKVARQVGNWMGRARAMARQLSDQLEREVNAEELLKEHSRPKPSMTRLPPLEPDGPQYMPPAVAPQYAAPAAPVSSVASDTALVDPHTPPSPLPTSPAPGVPSPAQSFYDAPSNGSGHADYEPPVAGAADPAHRSQ